MSPEHALGEQLLLHVLDDLCWGDGGLIERQVGWWRCAREHTHTQHPTAHAAYLRRRLLGEVGVVHGVVVQVGEGEFDVGARGPAHDVVDLVLLQSLLVPLVG